jgi:dihydrofolate reductase
VPTIYNTATSLDGFIADPDHGLGWLFQFANDGGEAFAGFLAGVGAIAMGASTYLWLLEHHVKGGADGGAPWPYATPAWVFTSRRLPGVVGADVHFVSGDVTGPHDDMLRAAGDRDVWIVGGGELAGQFYDRRRLDRVIVTIASVTLGAGAPLLPRRIHPPLRLSSVTRTGPEFVELHYDVVHDEGTRDPVGTSP